MPGHLFIHSVQELKYCSTEDIIPVHDDTVRKVLGNWYQSKWNYCCDFTVVYQRDTSLGHTIPLALGTGLL